MPHYTRSIPTYGRINTTKSTAIPASLYSPLPWFISAKPKPSWPTARWCSIPLTKRTRTASFGDRQNHWHYPWRFGSTGRFQPAKRQRKKISKFPCRVLKVLDPRREAACLKESPTEVVDQLLILRV